MVQVELQLHRVEVADGGDFVGLDQRLQLRLVQLGLEGQALAGRVHGPQRGGEHRAAGRIEVHRRGVLHQLAHQRQDLARRLDAEGRVRIDVIQFVHRRRLGVHEGHRLSR